MSKTEAQTIDEIIAQEAENHGFIVEEIKVTGDYKDLVKCLPHIFRKDGTVKRAPGTKSSGKIEDVIRQVKHAETQCHFVAKGEDLTIASDAGTLIVMASLRDIIHELDLYVAMVTKGWVIGTTQF